MSETRLDCDVLIVGLGPVGATLAGLLGDAGLSVIAVDRDTDIFPLPRAVHFDHEIMRIFQHLGLAEAVSPHTRIASAYEFRAADGQALMRFEGLDRPARSGWSASYMFHQPGLEAVLRAKLAAAPGVDVRLGHAFESLVQDGEGVTATIAGPDGSRTAVRARYLVGCDGASSPVRQAIGGGLDDLQFDEPWLVVDATEPEGSRLPDINLQICDPARPTTCVLSGPGRHRWEFMLLPGETAEDALAEGFADALIAKWDGAADVRIERRAVYRFHGLVARRWRCGRVLLAGDACHQTPPFAGQGMCAGLRDAANLAWKLEAVVRGRAEEALLDSYQTEREPHVRHFIALAIGMGRTVCTLDPDEAARRDAGMRAQSAASPAVMPPAPDLTDGCLMAGAGAGTVFLQPWAEIAGERTGLDDILGHGAWLIVAADTPAPAAAPEGVAVHSLGEARLAPFAGPIADWLTQTGADAVLVRPDRYVFGAGRPAELARAWAAALARPAPAPADSPAA